MKDFLSTVAHELRSPLATVGGFATTLLHYWESMPDEEKRNLLEVIARQARRMERLIRNLVTLSELDAGTVRPEPVSVSVAGAIRQATGEDSSDVNVSCPEDLEAMIDADHLHRIIEEFLENARLHGVAPIDVKATASDGAVEIRVCDAGAGPPEDLTPKLFDAFTRGGEPTSGSGLGLSVARRLAEANGGEVWFRPDDCFGVRLPATPSNMR